MTITSWIRDKAKKAIIYGATLAVLATPTFAQKKFEVKKGYNALETAVTNNGDNRTRALTNIDAVVGDAEVGYHGLNETTDAKKDNYFGRHVITAGKKGASTKAAAVVKTLHDRVLDAKYGVRNTSIPKNLGGYGWIDATVDNEGGNVTLFYGKSLGKGISAEVFHSTEKPFKGKAQHYDEVQFNKLLTSAVSAYVRGEVSDFKILTNEKAMVGISYSF